MTALSEGNGLNYRSYLGINSTSQLSKSICDSSNDMLCEKQNVNHAPAIAEESEDSAPVVDIVINNVVSSFNLRCHLNLKFIAMNGANVEYRRENGMVTMKLRHPGATASIWSSGKITCTGATSDADAKKAARRFSRIIQQLGFKVKFTNFRIVNVLGTCSMPFHIKISQFSMKHRQNASYEPELHPGVTYKIKDIRATLKIFSTGSITITAPCVENIQRAVEHIFPLVQEFRKECLPELLAAAPKQQFQSFGKPVHVKKEPEHAASCDSGGVEKNCDARWK